MKRHSRAAASIAPGVAALILLASMMRAAPQGEPIVERTFMPDAAPSSFAVGFPNGVGFCFDPVRGGVSYAWRGGFVDLTPARPGIGKFIQPVRLPSAPFYRETGPSPLRRGERTRGAEAVFQGYRLHPASVEFQYTIDGVPVSEDVSLRPGGDGLIRRFRIGRGGTDSRWWYVPGAIDGLPPRTGTAHVESGAFRFDPGGAREFTLEIIFPDKP